MKKFRRFLAAVVVVTVLALSMSPVFAADETTASDDAATVATNLGMLKGTGDGVTAEYLALPTTRIQAAIMQLRLLGLEADALAYDGTEKYADAVVSSFQKPILAYLNANPDLGWVGDGEGKFNPNAVITAQEYYKVMLVSLGYEYSVDFAWEDTLGFAKALGLYQTAVTGQFTNNNVAVATVEALKAEVKGGGMTLAEKIAASDSDFATKAAEAGIIALVTAESVESLKDVDLVVGDDAAAKLAKTVKVTMSDKTVQDIAVTWDKVDTTKVTTAAVEVAGTIAGIDAFKASVKVNVKAPVFAIDKVGAANLGEVDVAFNYAVDATKLTTIANYTVKVGVNTLTVAAATAAADNKSVKLTLAEATPLTQNAIVDVTVGTGILAAAATKSSAAITDTTLPAVSTVVLTGNKQITVTFSKPVKNAGALTLANYKIDGNYFNGSFAAALSANRKVVVINITNRLTAGDHTVVVSNVVDDANYPVGPNSSKVTVATDTTAPAISKLVSASQTSLVVEFTKEIETPAASDITSTQGVATATSVSGKTLTVTFGTPLPTTAVTVTFNNITDLFANKAAALTLSVTATADVVRPEVKSVTSTAQNAIIVEFSKTVVCPAANAGYFIVKNSAGTDVTSAIAAPAYVKAADGVTDVKTQIKLVNATPYTAGAYTVYISNIVDINPLNNVILPVVMSVTVPDKTAPALVAKSIIPAAGVILDTSANNKMYIQFNKAVTAATATALANYQYVSNTGAIATIPSNTSIQLLSDGKTVCLTFVVATLNVANIATIQVSGVADAAGNVMATTAVSAATAPAGFGTVAAGVIGPAIATAKATAANTIVLTLAANSSLIASSVTTSDFTITAGTATLVPISAVYDGTTTPAAPTITLTLASGTTLTANAKYGGNAVVVTTNAVTNSYDIYGTKLQANAATGVTDGIAPTAVIGSVYYNTAAATTTIDVNLSEQLALADGAATTGEFTVLIGGVAKIATGIHLINGVAGYGSTLRFTVTLANSDNAVTNSKAVRVVFFATPTTTFKDVGNLNKLVNFDVSGTVAAASQP